MHCLHRKYRSKSTSSVDVKTSLSKFFPKKKPPIITNQSSSSSRASHSIITYSIPQPKLIQSAFSLNTWNYEIASTILSFCDLQLILSLRLVSKIFHLTSTIATDRPSPLANHAIIFFPFFRLISNFDDDSDYKQKFAFAKQRNLKQHIIVSVNDLRFSPLKLNSIQKNKLNIILEIDLYPEILQLQNLLKQKINNCIDFLSRVNELKFSQLNTQDYPLQLNLCHANQGPSINLLLATISKNLNYFPNLSSLSIGDIGKNATRKVPALNTLTYLSIGTIWPTAIFEITDSLDKLRILYIEVIHPGATLQLPNLLPNLFQLHIETILNNTYIELPKAFSKISKISIGTLSNKVSLKLPNSFDNLSHFTIDHISESATLILPDSLPSLSGFSIADHIAILTITPQGQKIFKFKEPTNNFLFEDLLKYINEKVGNLLS